MTFEVIDTKTGEYPDLWKIALEEDWANGLMYCDMEGFAIEEDGTLILLDECGKHAYCPEGRFKIILPKGKWLVTEAWPHRVYCSCCCKTFALEHWEIWKDGSLSRNFCPNCGADMRGETE